MYLLRLLLFSLITTNVPLRAVSDSAEIKVEPTDSAMKLININNLESHCRDGICRNYYYPNITEIMFFDLKTQVRILDDTTYNIFDSVEFDTLVFKNSTFANFPLHFFDSISVRELDMRNCSIQKITWENFLMAEKLSVLLLSQNRITSITEMTFNYATELQYLFLDANQIRMLVSESFKGLSQLRYLDLSYNRLRELPGTVFAYLTVLNELNLAGNRLNYLPNEVFSRNQQLKSVVLRENRLRTLDEYLFKNQPNLVFVDLSHNIPLSQMIMNIQTKYLIAANCSLYLVNLYGQVTNADLRDNEIVELYFAQPESLEKLVLRNNALQQIASLTKAVNLHELNVADNPGLGYLSEPWSANSLERLDFSNTSLSFLPIASLAEQTNLHVLNVSNNKLEEINPRNYKYLEKLTHFYIDANDWNCFSLRLLFDFLIKPNNIVYKHDPFDPTFSGEYIEGIACMYRVEDSEETESSLNELLNPHMPFKEQLKKGEINSYDSTNEYPTAGDTDDQKLRREITALRKELKAIVSFYESKFDKVVSEIDSLNKRIANFEHLNETMFEHITIMT